MHGLMASFCYATLSLFIKLAKDIPTTFMIFSRSLFCLIFLYSIVANKQKFSLKTQKPLLHFLRVFLGLCGMFCIFVASKKLHLVNAMLLMNTSPLFIPIVIYIWFKKKIPNDRVFALIIGFIGISLILKPTSTVFQYYSLIGLLAGLLFAVAFVMMRTLSKTEPIERMLCYFFLGGIIFSVFLLFFSWQSVTVSKTFFYLLPIGLLGFLFQWLNTKAYSYVSPSRISVMGYFTIVFSGIIEWIIWGKSPDFSTCIGMLFIVSSGFYILLEKNTLQHKSTN